MELPAVEESTSYGTPAFKVRKKLFARLREEGDILVVKVDRDERAALIESEPEIYFTTPHYENYGYVLVRPGADGDIAVMGSAADPCAVTGDYMNG